MDALKRLLMAAVIFSIAVLVGVLAPAVTFLAIALVSLKGTQPAERPAILRALALLPRHRDEHGPQVPGAASRALTIRRRSQARAIRSQGPRAGPIGDESAVDDVRDLPGT